MKRFIIRTLLISAPILLLLISVNYFGDAAKLFSKNYEKKIANEIAKGKNVTNIANYDERLLQKYLILNSSVCPNTLIVGSSREMLIHAAYFKDSSFFNNSVSGASLEDILAIIQLYAQKGCIPGKIVIGLDPWTLNDNNNQDRWKALGKEYYECLNSLKIKPGELAGENLMGYQVSKYTQLLSLSYFKSSIKVFFKPAKPRATEKSMNNLLTKLADGSINYGADVRLASQKEVDAKALSYLKGDVYSIEKFDELSPEKEQILERLVQYLKNKKIEIVFLLAPYHPKVYSFIDKTFKYRKVKESEAFFISLGSKYGIKAIGSFDPNNLNLPNSDFYDGMHCNEKGVSKWLANVQQKN